MDGWAQSLMTRGPGPVSADLMIAIEDRISCRHRRSTRQHRHLHHIHSMPSFFQANVERTAAPNESLQGIIARSIDRSRWLLLRRRWASIRTATGGGNPSRSCTPDWISSIIPWYHSLIQLPSRLVHLPAP